MQLKNLYNQKVFLGIESCFLFDINDLFFSPISNQSSTDNNNLFLVLLKQELIKKDQELIKGKFWK